MLKTLSPIPDWMEQNIDKYTSRKEFFRACRKEIGCHIRTVEHWYTELFAPVNNLHTNDILEDNRHIEDDNEEVVLENVRLAKRTQKAEDRNRIERKAFRSAVRVENAVEEYNKELIKLLKENALSILTIKHKTDKEEAVAIVQLSDLHMNELIKLPCNEYNYNIACQRLAYFADKIVKYLAVYKIKNILLAFTGDLLNSDKKLDQLLNNASNRSQAVFLAADILQQFIRDLNKHYNITCITVSGNESRVSDEVGWSEIVLNDNYDTSIFNVLYYIFKGAPGVTFVFGDSAEQVVNVAGHNILFMHGYGLPGGQDVEKQVQQIKGKYSGRNIDIRYVVFGHIHSARIGDNYARCSSLAGANAYSERGLQLEGRASQNLYIVFKNGNIDGIKVDLQNAQIDGYNIDTELEAYNTKSTDKLKKHDIIVQVVI